MKKVLNFIRRVGGDIKLHNFAFFVLLSIFNTTNGSTCHFLFGELPFPEEAYANLKGKIRSNQE